MKQLQNAGGSSFQDEPPNAAPVNHIDDRVDTRYHNQPNRLVANGDALSREAFLLRAPRGI